MKRRRIDPVSVLISLKKRSVAVRPAPLASIPADEIAAFQTLAQILQRSKLMAILDQKEATPRGERAICIDEALLAKIYPGLNPLADPLPEIDAFIYVYEAMSGHDIVTRAKGDLRQYLGGAGFRHLLLELKRSCQIHQFCVENLRGGQVVIEPITLKPTIEARKDALAIHGQAKEVFHQMAERMQREISAANGDLPRVFMDACRFAGEMTAMLTPLALAGRRVRECPNVKKH
jgi:hypothetical protein